MALSNEEKREKFIKHGNRRLINAVKNIKLLKNIANKIIMVTWKRDEINF